MKRGYTAVVFVLIALLCVPSALAIWYMDAESVIVDLDITSGLQISRTPGSTLDYVTASVSFIPRNNEYQDVLRVDADPKPVKVTDDEYFFRWEAPESYSPSFDISARIATKNTVYDVRKITFPYTGFSDDIAEYVKPTKNIDSDHAKIIDKASELASGESDYYAVVFKMAEWTKENVEYDLSTLNTKAAHKASFVLGSKNGVCDEITTLFMGLLRAVGIPARFVSGIAYTESPEFPQKWGAHGWAEVYFPGTGWVPFDVTYGEFGYIDPTHIKLKDSFDSGDSDTKYEWLGRDVNVVTDPMRVSADIVRHIGTTPDPVSLQVGVVQDRVGIGSYNVVEAAVTNKRNSYVSTELFIARIDELEVDGERRRAVMLKPLEIKKIYWLVKVIDNLDSHYTYTFPMTVADPRNTSADSLFYVLPGATVFTRAEMERVIDAAVEEESKVFSKKIELNCSQAAEHYYVYDDPVIECLAKNTGNFPFKGLEFCYGDECTTADLAISQEKAFPYTLHGPKSGINKVEFSIKGKDVSKTVFYDLDVLDEPVVSVDDLEYPSQIEFGKPYEVLFTLKRSSAAIPQKIVMEFDAAGLKKSVEASELNVDKKYLFNLDSSDLSLKPNVFTVSVNFEDLNGRTYTQKEEFEIGLVNVTFGQRMIIFLHDADRWIRNLFK